MRTEAGSARPNWPEPPTGAHLDQFMAEMKADVLERIQPRPRKRITLGLAGTITAALVVLGVGAAAGAAVATTAINSGQALSGTATLALPVPDFGATQLVVTFTCLTEGSYTVTLSEPGGTEMAIECDKTGPTSATTEFTINDPSRPRALSITASIGGTYSVDAEYVTRAPVAYPTNDHGQSYGSPTADATNVPDLVFAIGEDNDGLPVQGYVLYADTRMPDDLADGKWIEWLTTFHAKYPDGQPLPLYSSNGTTTLGTFLLYR